MPNDEISFKIMKYGDDADTLSDKFKEIFTNPKWRKYLVNKFIQGDFWDELKEFLEKYEETGLNNTRNNKKQNIEN